MSLEDEINRWKKIGDPRKNVGDLCKTEIDKVVDYYAAELYQKICTIIASKKVFNTDVENYVYVEQQHKLEGIIDNNPVFLEFRNAYNSDGISYMYECYPEIHRQQQGWTHIYCVSFYNNNRGIVTLTHSGELLFNALCEMCEVDHIIVKPCVRKVYSDYYRLYSIDKNKDDSAAHTSLVARFELQE